MPGEGGTGGGTGTGTATGGDDKDRRERRGPQISRKRKRNYQQPTELVDRLIHQYGSRDRALEELAGENYDLREDRRERDEEIDGLKKKLVPDGAVVLTGAKAESWKKIDALATELKLADDKIGETVVARVKQADTLEGEKKKAELSTKRKDVATKASVNGDVLDPLLDQFGLDVELRPVTVITNGKSETVQVAHIKKAGDANASWEKLSDFVDRDGSPLKPFKSALATKPAGAAGGSTGGSTGHAATGITFPEQTGGGGGGSSSVVDDILKRNKESASRPNPLSTRQPQQTDKGTGGAAA